MQKWSKREVLAYLARVGPVLSKLDHYELLDVKFDGDAKAIHGAFRTMAQALHPDRHRNDLSAAELEKLTVVYAKIAEAYRVLRDPKERDLYLKNAARQQARGQVTEASVSTSDHVALLSPKAQKLYRRASAAIRTGDTGSAVLYMKMALASHPQSTFLKEALKKINTLP